jgi:hypothetical protein
LNFLLTNSNGLNSLPTAADVVAMVAFCRLEQWRDGVSHPDGVGFERVVSQRAEPGSTAQLVASTFSENHEAKP